MPIYEYRCSECGFQDEFLQKHSDPQMTVCPSCGKEALKKLLSAAGFQLKGSGWYATDFKGSGAKPAARSGEDSKGGSDAAGEKSSGETAGDKASADKPVDKPSDKPSDKSGDKSSDKAATAPKPTPASTSG